MTLRSAELKLSIALVVYVIFRISAGYPLDQRERIYGGNPQKTNECEDRLDIQTCAYLPQIANKKTNR